MAIQQHRVRRQVLEVQVPEESAAGEAHRQLGRIQRQYLESIIESCCSEISSPDRLHRIEKLELDLGRVTFADMEAELPRSLRTSMRQALRKETEAIDRKASAGDGHPATRSQLELVAIFAKSGALPWWADSRRSRHVPESIDFLLIHAPDDLASLLRDLLHDSGPLLRIVLHCDDEMLVRVFENLSPSAAAASPTSVIQQLKWVFGESGLKATANFSRTRNALWGAALTHVSWADALPSAQSPTDTAPSIFWVRVFHAVAARSPQAFEAVLAAVRRQTRSFNPVLRHTAAPVVAAFVEVGKHQGRASDATFTEVADWLRTVRSPEETPQDRRLVPDRETAQTAEAAVLRDSLRQQTADHGIEAGNSEIDGNQPLSQPVTTQILAERGISRDARPLDLRFGDADSVYIENSGLAILWPFLERFFERLRLLQEKKFVDVAAQRRAAGLLQYVATEDSSPPEYQMLLNKMLCGIGPDDLMDFGPPVTGEEMQECESLLSAAIDNAPVLRNISHEGFRGSFLLRKGALSAGDGSWLLRVERETFDVVLDRFPWSFGWIKLPWMEAPLAVEW